MSVAKLTHLEADGVGVSGRKLTREEQKARRELEKAFQASLKQQVKAAGWGYIKPTSYKRIGEWLVALHPVVWTDAERSEMWAWVKPFPIDDLISRILGFEGLDGKPLSLLARGPHCLVRPMYICAVESGGDLNRMTGLASEFSKKVTASVEALALGDFIAFTADDVPVGKVSVNQVAALILAGRSDEATALCEKAVAAKQWGGPARAAADGSVVGFFELALAWLRKGPKYQPS
jgi:hypothetical protein